jgi:23S rRNA pseudouridine1911/1915/1917 synthase
MNAAMQEQDNPARVLIAGPGDTRQRLDQFVASALAPERSRAQVARMIKAGMVTINGVAAIRASCVVRSGDRIELAAPPAVQVLSHQQNVPPVEVLYHDAELIVVNKPAGMTVHPAPGHAHSTLADALLARFPELAAMAEPDGVMRAGIVHRLDKDTSGVMVVARTPWARMALSQQFKDRTVSKVYVALVWGIVRRDCFTVERPLGRHPTERKRMSVRSRHPRAAITYFHVLERFCDADAPITLLKAKPETGRTHQIRVHLAASGHPCLGDPLYGRACELDTTEWMRGGQALHALKLTVNHPRTAQRSEFIAPPARDMTDLIARRGAEIGPAAVERWLESE